MKICLITMLLMIALQPVCFAGEEFFIEDETLKPVSDSITQVILSYEKEPDWKTCKFIGKPIDLDGDGKAEDFAVTTADGCNCGNAICTIWVLRRTGNSYSVVLSDGGYSMNVGKQMHNGLADISFEASTAGWSQKSSWQFDGKRYVSIKQKTKTTR
jgi:hypothetical protein